MSKVGLCFWPAVTRHLINSGERVTDNTKFAERFEDMSRLGRLHVLQQDDGDMIVAIIEDPNNPSYGFPTVEFCTSG